MDDAEVVTSIQQALYTSLNNKWYAKYGEYIGRTRFYRSDLIALDGTITFETTLTNVRSSNGSTIFNYLPAIEGLNFSGCTSLISTYTPSGGTAQNLFVFNHMPQLEVLNVYNCSSLTEDIDLTMCDDLTEVDARGTSINVLIPTGSKITKYELGTPTSISLVNPTVLQPSGVKVSSYGNLDSLVIKNIPNAKSYSVFAKIMKSMGAEMMIGTYVDNYGNLTTNSAWATSTEIYNVAYGDSLISTADGYCYIIEYYTNGDHRVAGISANTAYVVGVGNRTIDYIRYVISSNVQSATLTNNTSGKILVKYEA